MHHCIYLELTAVLAFHVYIDLVGIACETAGIFKEVCNCLITLHLIDHRTLYLSVCTYERLVGWDKDDVALLKGHVVR